MKLSEAKTKVAILNDEKTTKRCPLTREFCLKSCICYRPARIVKLNSDAGEVDPPFCEHFKRFV